MIKSGNYVGGIQLQPGKHGDFYGIYAESNGPVIIGCNPDDWDDADDNLIDNFI